MIIKDAHEDVLVREFDKKVSGLLHDSSLVVKRAVDFSTHVVAWSNDSSPTNAKTISMMLFRQCITFADAIAELVDRGCLGACPPLLRAQLEAMLNYVYLNAEESENRANAYRVGRIRDELKFAEKALKSTSTSTGATPEDESDYGISLPKEKIELAISKAKERLASDSLLPIDAEWIRTKKARKGVTHWYSLFDGPRNLRELAIEVGMKYHYDYLYGYWSQSIHSTNVLADIVDAGGGQAGIPKIRYPLRTVDVMTLCASMLLESIRRTIKDYANGRELDSAKWYQKQMAKEFKRIRERKVVMNWGEPDS